MPSWNFGKQSFAKIEPDFGEGEAHSIGDFQVAAILPLA